MAKKNKNTDKNIAHQIEKQMRWELAQQKKKKRRNILAVTVCSLIVIGLVVTMAITVFLPLAEKKADTASEDTTSQPDEKLTPANDGIETDDKLPKVSFEEKDAADGSKIKVPSIEMPSNYEKPTELQTKVLEKGKGAELKKEDTISAYYTGWFPGKEVFDSAYDRGEPSSFALTGVIKGWTEGLTGKHVGDTVLLVIPSKMAYDDENGKSTSPGTAEKPGIPDGADLIFVVKIQEIVKDKK